MTLADQLRRDEGYRARPYRDTAGHLTIGHGRNLDAVGLSEAEAEVLLQADINRATVALRRELPWTENLDEPRWAVLANMTFNLGIGVRGRSGLLGFTRMLDAVYAGAWERAATEMLDSTWATQVKARAERLAQQMRSGEWV